MTDIERAIAEAWDRVEPSLLADRAEFDRRLLRGRKLVGRPPRGWCLVVRANDTRINPETAYLVPQEAYPESDCPPELRGIEARHEVTITGELLRALSAPVYVEPPGQTTREIAAMLGVTPTGLLWSRWKGVFQTHHVRGLGGSRGAPVPLLHSKKPLFPSSPLFAAADSEWGETAALLCTRVPEELEQTLVRVPAFWPRGTFVDEEEKEWESAGKREGRRKPSLKLPPPEPDFASYKWKDGKYLGYDWKNPVAKKAYERHEHAKEMARERQQRNGPRNRKSESVGSNEFRGWLWICPVCEAVVKMLYLPVPPLELMPESLETWTKANRRPAGFACRDCHHITAMRHAHRNYWNEVVSYLSWGLLYGSEVTKSASWKQAAKRTRKKLGILPRTRERHAALERWLMEGWTNGEIAAELGISYVTVVGRIARLYAERGVHGGRKGLAAALGAAMPARRKETFAVAKPGGRTRKLCPVVRI